MQLTSEPGLEEAVRGAERAGGTGGRKPPTCLGSESTQPAVRTAPRLVRVQAVTGGTRSVESMEDGTGCESFRPEFAGNEDPGKQFKWQVP